VAILALILGDVYFPGLFVVGNVALWVVVVAALWSGADYFRRVNLSASAPKAPEVTAPEAAQPKEESSRRLVS
jgi:hypothetical protein